MAIDSTRVTATTGMDIYIDADAMPKAALHIARSLAQKYGAVLTTVSSIRHELTGDRHVTVDASPEATDMEILRRIVTGRDTIVVTQDYGLAALVLARRALAVSPTGLVFSTDNIDSLLAERGMKAKLRRAGKAKFRGPRPRTQEDDQRFEKALEGLILSCKSTVIRMDKVMWKRDQQTILSDIDWTLTRGQHWAILGLNGSGKTSLLQIVNGYQWPSKGSVEVLGETFGKTDLRELRRRIGWVSVSMADKIMQNHMTDTALQVVLSGRHASIGLWTTVDAKDEGDAYHQMDRLDCLHLAQLSFGNLSQGERQRILIARALMGQPDLLILDEPCSGLDILAREQLLTTIEALASNTLGPTLLYVTHHTEEIVASITHVLILDEGRVVCSLPKEEALVSPVLSLAFHVPVDAKKVGGRTWVTVLPQT